ncbi:SpoIIE family protein phosphatase [bacterium]|nr:SpoIIE family protein phosphatase [bacterium]
MTTTTHHDEHRILYLDLAETEGPLIRSLIEDNGWVPIPAFSSEDVLHRVDRERVDLILLDPAAKSIDCQTVLRELRFSLRPTRFLPILIVYPAGQGDVADPFLDAGANDVVSRPIHPRLFANRIRAYLSAKNTHDRLAETAAELTRERERMVAAQARIGSGEMPQLEGIHFCMRQVPCGKSGGDYAEVLPLDGERLAVILADVSGHGADATVHAAMLRTAVSSSLRSGEGPAAALVAANNVLLEALGTDDLITCYVGVLEPSTGRLTHATAGHANPWSTRPGAEAPEEIVVAGGPPLGVFESGEYEQSQTMLETGARLFLFTNGIWQQRDEQGEPFGLAQFPGLIAVTTSLELEDAGEFLVSSVETHKGETEWQDDVLVLILERPPVE